VVFARASPADLRRKSSRASPGRLGRENRRTCSGASAVVALTEKAKHVGYEQDEQYGAQPHARTSAITPTPMAIVSTTAAKNQQQDYNQYQHRHSPFLPIYFLIQGCHLCVQPLGRAFRVVVAPGPILVPLGGSQFHGSGALTTLCTASAICGRATRRPEAKRFGPKPAHQRPDQEMDVER
jgi:hypothetical protein